MRKLEIFLELQGLTSTHVGFIAEIFALGLSFIKDFIIIQNSGAIVDGLLGIVKLQACKSSVGVESKEILFVL